MVLSRRMHIVAIVVMKLDTLHAIVRPRMTYVCSLLMIKFPRQMKRSLGTCYSCGQHGHISSDCSNAISNNNNNNARNNPQCYRCGQFGHL